MFLDQIGKCPHGKTSQKVPIVSKESGNGWINYTQIQGKPPKILENLGGEHQSNGLEC